MYQPYCPFACLFVLSGVELNCSTTTDMDGMSMAETSSQCYATDNSYLQTLALCISTYCTDMTVSEIETFWEYQASFSGSNQPPIKESYQAALAAIKTTPELTFSGTVLNQTMIIDDSSYQPYWNALSVFQDGEVKHETYGLVLLFSGAFFPIAFSILRFLPIPRLLISKFYATVIDPPAFGKHHSVPIFYGLAIIPTRGEAIFIFYLVAINIIFSAIGFETHQPNAWYSTERSELLEYVGNRLGILSFANIGLLILYSSRNNFLRWFTNWNHATFLVLHRWIAILATVQASLHSILYLKKFTEEGTYNATSSLSFWGWGIVATVGMVILLPTSSLPIRQKFYEAFLAWHVVVTAFILAGCYLHIIDRFQTQYGYENWIYIAIGFWVFDRVTRLLRLSFIGVRKAEIKVLDDENVSIKIKGVSGAGHVYLYFPTLSKWIFWQNHPFSVTSDILDTAVTKSAEFAPKRGLFFLIRTLGGLTKKLQVNGTIPVLIEGSYDAHDGILRENIDSYPIMICIAGGVGITAVMRFARAHNGDTKLFWAVRNQTLVDSLNDELSSINKEIYVASSGQRMSIPSLLEDVIMKASDDVVVVVCGPAKMSDEVRNKVTRLARHATVGVKLVEESFSW
ncbi:hypothetical protein HK100_010391 [Physocladia obscura]|uniref:Ferric reductase n=1 Tax=Physocladia obscura TaxID=109957 RepID=A0AAD5XIW0_9FUNG|nr:hypothetical protein HK100_010391 [Physocladia obscura]